MPEAPKTETPKTVFEFLETPTVLPKVITIDRAKDSKYQFYLIVRHYKRRLGKKPEFITYNKAEQNAVKAKMEEFSIFDDNTFYVLEGFGQSFVEGLELPSGVYCVAETDGGVLKTESYSYKQRRDILKVLLTQLGMKLSLRSLLALDWSSMKDYSDYEVLLRRAKLMQWTEDQIGEQLKSIETGQLLILLKKNRFKEIFNLIEKYGPVWVHNHLIDLLTQVAHYKALLLMGYDKDRAARDLGIGWGRAKELEQTAEMLTNDDLVQMAKRLIKMDRLMDRNRELGLELALLNSPIRITR